MRELVRAGIQFPISNMIISAYERDGIWRRIRLQLHQVVYT
jgi:hypothetical protein